MVNNHSGCAVTGCEKPVRTRGYCYAHYMKAWRYGTPEPTHPPRAADIIGQRYGLLVVQERIGRYLRCLCDCGDATTVAIGDLNRGSTQTCGNRTIHHRADTVEYSGMHSRLRTERGPASDHQCNDCNRQAAQWSYNHDDPAERVSITEQTLGIAYSLDPDHYSPRCVPCHKRFDLDRIDAHQQSA